MADPSLLLTTVGVAGTLAGSGLTGFISARLERRKEAAAERTQLRQEQAADRVHIREQKIEHYRWRRDRRQSAYVDFYAKSQELLLLFTKLHVRVQPGAGESEATRQLLQEADEVNAALHKLTAVVNVEGPRNVSNQASLIQTRLSLLMASAVRALNSSDPGEAIDHRDQLQQSIETLTEAQTSFLNLAHAALEDIETLN
ncbi:hypothetical protein QA802_18205 [Streptomyces sp. B21-105]|uniref:hypothetical protein n=1 Tax=Streptomyces sp. B21-105 TaxID=3039417 RepID=UPI002FF0144D